MNLSQAFRKAVERVGLEDISKKGFWNIVKDLCPVENNSSFLWEIMIERGFIDQFLDLKDSDFEIDQYISRICYNTGLSYDKVAYLLHEFREGVARSFYGINPQHNSENSLRHTCLKNKELWINRAKQLENGVIIAKINGKYGVLSLSGEILPFKYKGATKFAHGIGCFNDGNTTGFINIMGNLEIELTNICDEFPCISIGHFENGIAKLYGFNHKVGYMSITKEHTECIYDDSYLNNSYNGLYEISKDGLKGLMNYHCEIIIEPQFTYLSDFGKGDKLFLGKNDKNEWFIIKSNGNITKTILHNPSIVGDGIIQEISILSSKVRYNFYDADMQKINNTPIDYSESYDSRPIFIHKIDGLYHFIFKGGFINSHVGYEKAFPFGSDYTWVQVGDEWHKIDFNGGTLEVMRDGDVLTKVVNNRILRRNKKTSLIEIFNCQESNVEFIIEKSNNIVVSELFGRMSCLGTYAFTINSKYYLWTEGQLFSSDIQFTRCKISKRNIYSCLSNDGNIRIICNGVDLGFFARKNSDDKFMSVFQLDNLNEIIYYKTSNGLWYMYNINKQTYSDYYPKINIYSVKDRLAKAIIAENASGISLLLNDTFDIVASANEINVTSNKDFFKIEVDGKIGLISYDGSIVIEPKYESLSYYRTHI